MIPDSKTNCVFLASSFEVRFPKLFARIRETLLAHEIKVRLVDVVRDIWLRDFCPVQVGPKEFVKFRYAPDYLRDSPKLRTGDEIVNSLGDLGQICRSDIILDGGNVVATEHKAILTDKIYKENPGRKRPDLRDELRRLLRVEELIVVPKEPYDPFGHTDSMVRFLDEHMVLVNDYPVAESRFRGRLAAVLREHDLAIELVPYFHEKLTRNGIPSAVGCFTNFLQTSRVIVAPTYDTDKHHDATQRLQALFPKVPVVPLDATDLARDGGVFNCVAAAYCVEPTISQNKLRS